VTIAVPRPLRAHAARLSPPPRVGRAVLIAAISAADVASAWNELFTRMPGHTGAQLLVLVRRVFSEHRTLPTQVRERLTVLPVRG